MNIKILAIFLAFVFISQITNGQSTQKFLDAYNYDHKYGAGKINKYDNVQGSPYLNDKFIEGTIYFKDTSALKLLLRFNIYENVMEYKMKEENFIIGNPEIIDKIVINENTFMYLPYMESKGFFEVLISGKSSLVQKMIVKIQEAQPAKPYNDAIPAKFTREKDLFFIVNSSGIYESNNQKSVLNALKDQHLKIESFIEQEKIKKIKKESLINIVNYYNSL